MAEQLLYKGKIYKRRKGKWIDEENIIVSMALQNDLNREFAENLVPEELSRDDCVMYGDSFKNTNSLGLAIKFYEEAFEKADKKSMAYILPRITSCYRKCGEPQKAIDVLTYASSTFGSRMVTPALLISAAAAYCDLEDYVRAKKCCDRAYGALGGRYNEELSLVYKRIEKAVK